MAGAQQIGFETGNEFQATPITGTVMMTCDDINGRTRATYTCRNIVLDPHSSDYFLGPLNPDITQVIVTATHEDGTLRTKISNYDGLSGKSKSAINLWISTLFQKPLLMKGMNHIHYAFTNSASVDSSEYKIFTNGEMNVVVKTGAGRQCPTTQYTSNDANDCVSPYSICQSYFANFNNCN